MNISAVPDRSQKDVLLCLSHLRWNLVFQRPHHLLTRAAREFQVIYVEEAESGERDDIRLQRHGDILIATPVLGPGKVPGSEDSDREIAYRLAELVELHTPRRLVLWLYTPMALPLAAGLDPDCVVYDCMDELSLFAGAPPSLHERERRLLADCDLLFTGGASLQEAKQAQRPDAHCFPSSIDAAHFSRARSGSRRDPEDQAAIPHPRIGYFGVLDERLDRELVAELAAARPDWHFVMLGPVVKIRPDDLPQAANIHWLGPKRYEELPEYLGGWDAGFMPFALNDATRFISPTKTPEFLAAGLAVASTPVRDVVRGYGDAGLVEIASGAQEMEVALARVLAARDDPDRLDAVRRRLATMSWDQSWAAMRDLVLDRLAANLRSSAHSESHAHV